MIATCTTRLISQEGVSRNVIGSNRLNSESGFPPFCSTDIDSILGIATEAVEGTGGFTLKWLRASNPLNDLLCKESATTAGIVSVGNLNVAATLGRIGTNGGGKGTELAVEFFDESAVAGGGGTIASTISEDF